MIARIEPSNIFGEIVSSPSKSSMQRACAAALLHIGDTIIYNPGESDDDLAALDIIQKLGATVNRIHDGSIQISSKGVKPIDTTIHCGESGLSLRMFTSIAALSNQRITMSGQGSLLKRPIHFFDKVLPKLHVEVLTNEGKLPITIKGPLNPVNIEMDSEGSSQYLTGLLMAYSVAVTSPTVLTVNNLESKPYIDLSLSVMQTFGMNIPENDNYQTFTFLPKKPVNNQTIQYTIEGDWSGASFLLVAGAIAGNVVVSGLQNDSTQADRAILQVLKNAGCQFSELENSISVSKSNLTGFQFDATDCPDLFPPLVALASFCKGTSEIKGVKRLTHKESNRSEALQLEFAKMNIEIEIEGDIMKIHGGGMVSGAKVHSHGDHRIAMACAVAALRANDEVVIEHAEAINKSYPLFFDHLKKLGATVLLC